MDVQTDFDPVLLTVEEAARALKIGRTKMYALIKTGEVESVQVGRLRRVPVEELPKYVANLLSAAQSDRAAA